MRKIDGYFGENILYSFLSNYIFKIIFCFFKIKKILRKKKLRKVFLPNFFLNTNYIGIYFFCNKYRNFGISMGKVILEALQASKTQLIQGAIVTVNPRKKRIHLLPLKGRRN